ncbi:MAG: sulfatase [Myxococcota bacterium]|nr:sulfatase [Myxococcota bacterium]
MRVIAVYLVVLVSLGLAGCSERPSTVVLITLDTTRADHLGCYGYTRNTSPNLDAFARDAIVYERAIAPGTWTLPSHASLFTGKLTTSHGAQYDPNGALRLRSALEGPDSWDAYRARTISVAERTLAERLGEAGFYTGAVVGGVWLKSIFGLARGFDDYDEDNISSVNGRPAEDVTDRAIAWLEQTEGPRFLFLNYFDPHSPFEPPDEFARRFVVPGAPEDLAHAIGLYDAEIAYMDHHLGRFFQALRDAGLYDQALIVVTADHGELLGEHGDRGHGRVPFQEVVHIPLIVKMPGPGGPTGRRLGWVQLNDVFPLILESLGLEVPGDIQGEAPPGGTHPIIVESRTIPPTQDYGEWQALIEGESKFIRSSRGFYALFDLRDSPGEARNVASEHPERVRAMRERLDHYLAGLPRPGGQAEPRVLDPETQQALENLGYLE